MHLAQFLFLVTLLLFSQQAVHLHGYIYCITRIQPSHKQSLHNNSSITLVHLSTYLLSLNTMNMNTASTTTATSSNMLSVPSSTSTSSGIDINNPTRPAFNSQRTQDRLREGEGLYAMLFRSDSNKLQRGRKSVFKETGLDDDSTSEVTDVSSLRSPVASPSPLSPSSSSSVSSQGPSPLPPFPSLKLGPLESWYV